MTTERPGSPLRLAVLGDLDGMHTRRWINAFVGRGHEVHAISYYLPRFAPLGATLHVLVDREPPSAARGISSGAGLRAKLPPSALRLVHAWRYRLAGLKQTLAEIAPDVFHAHYVVEHGFYGAMAGFHPYVVSAWGSDIFQAPRTPLGRYIAQYSLRRADLITANDPAMAQRILGLGARPGSVALVRLGVDAVFLDTPARSVNLLSASAEPPTVISDRALEPLYNVDVVLRAFARVRQHLATARLLIAGDGSERPHLEALAHDLGQGGAVRFLGQLEPAALRDTLAGAHVYVSVPSSDSLSLSTMEAMATGAFPVVSDLPSQDWIVHRVNGLRVPTRDEAALTSALQTALSDAALRRQAVAPNRARVESEGNREQNMDVMERYYYRLAGRPVGGEEGI